jgi:hypothetical protein
MSFRLMEPNAIVVARQFNPSIVSQMWLVNTGIVPDGGFGDEFAFTPVFAQVVTEQFALQIIPERLQFTPKVPVNEQKSLVTEKVGKFVRALPHTPYAAVGLNFSFHLVPDQIDVRDLTRSLFFVPDSPIHKAFDAPDAQFGGYVSRDALGCRFKLDVKPCTLKPASGGEQQFVALDFNFHRDIAPGPTAAEDVVKLLERWDEAKAIACEVVQSVAQRDRK